MSDEVLPLTNTFPQPRPVTTDNKNLSVSKDEQSFSSILTLLDIPQPPSNSENAGGVLERNAFIMRFPVEDGDTKENGMFDEITMPFQKTPVNSVPKINTWLLEENLPISDTPTDKSSTDDLAADGSLAVSNHNEISVVPQIQIISSPLAEANLSKHLFPQTDLNLPTTEKLSPDAARFSIIRNVEIATHHGSRSAEIFEGISKASAMGGTHDVQAKPDLQPSSALTINKQQSSTQIRSIFDFPETNIQNESEIKKSDVNLSQSPKAMDVTINNTPKGSTLLSSTPQQIFNHVAPSLGFVDNNDTPAWQKTIDQTYTKTLTLTLDPPELGSVIVNMILKDGRLHLRLQSESPETARLIQKGQDELISLLSKAGYGIESVSIVNGALATPIAAPNPTPASQAQINQNGFNLFHQGAGEHGQPGARKSRHDAANSSEIKPATQDEALRFSYSRGIYL